MVATFIFSSCSEDYLDSSSIDGDTAFVTLSMDVPGLSSPSSRTMSSENESKINSIQAFMFEVTESGDIFRYKVDDITSDHKKLKLRVKVDKSEKKYRIVLFANTDLYRKKIDDKTPKKDVLKLFSFTNTQKWTADKHIPMWGESEPILLKGNTATDIILHRSLARVDVGTRFKFNDNLASSSDDKLKEEVLGLDNFKIEDVRVYRTLSSGYVASLHSLIGNEVKQTSIPEGAKYNSESGEEFTSLEAADANPLVYGTDFISEGVEPKIVREIYIPEAEGSNLDDIPCIVVGGYYGEDNTDKITYYRADFNEEKISETVVLRNHRYVFDIQSVSGPGFETPEEALRGIKSPMEVNVISWNEIDTDYYVQGDYFMKIAEREISMDAIPQKDETKVTYEIPFETNLVLTENFNKDNNNPDLRKDFVLKWHKGDNSPFEVSVDYAAKKFVFSAPQNSGANSQPLNDILRVAVESFTFYIKVNQNSSNIKYSLQCESAKVNGVYREGVELNYTNYITINIETTESMEGEEYEIKTIEQNGIYFYAKGVLTADKYQEIKLEGRGTLVNNSGKDFLNSFDVTILSNSMEGTSECSEARILVGYKSKKILTIGANAFYRFGYQLEPNTASRTFVDASINFGTNPNSKVIMERGSNGSAFEIKMLTLGQGMTGEWIDNSALVKAITEFKPDIILTGQAIDYFDQGTLNDTKNINLLSKFVDAGGVFLMCNEYYPFASSIDAMVSKIMGDGVSGKILPIGFDQLFTMQGNDEDMIVNGPFGNMKQKNGVLMVIYYKDILVYLKVQLHTPVKMSLL